MEKDSVTTLDIEPSAGIKLRLGKYSLMVSEVEAEPVRTQNTSVSTEDMDTVYDMASDYLYRSPRVDFSISRGSTGTEVSILATPPGLGKNESMEIVLLSDGTWYVCEEYPDEGRPRYRYYGNIINEGEDDFYTKEYDPVV